MRSRRALAALAVAVLALLGVACGGQPNAATITLTEFTIKPKGVTLKAGQPATLTLVNGGKIDHNLKLDPAVSTSEPTGRGRSITSYAMCTPA